MVETPRANTPAYKAGLDVGDEVRSFDGNRVTTPDDVMAIVRRHKPGDTVSVEYVDRTALTKSTKVVLGEDPRLELVTAESTGRPLTKAETTFRNAWLGRRGQ